MIYLLCNAIIGIIKRNFYFKKIDRGKLIEEVILRRIFQNYKKKNEVKNNLTSNIIFFSQT